MSRSTDSKNTSPTRALPRREPDVDEWEIVQRTRALSGTYPDSDNRKIKLRYLLERLQTVSLNEALEYDHHVADLGVLIYLTSEMKLAMAEIHGVGEKEVWEAGVEHMWKLWEELKDPGFLTVLKKRFGES